MVTASALDLVVISAVKAVLVNKEFTVTVIISDFVDKVKLINNIESSGTDRDFYAYTAPQGGGYNITDGAFGTFKVSIVK